jgi:N-acetylmuramoyl-L-alanine amidase
MFQTNTINLSKTFASNLIDQIGRVHCLKYPVFHEAPFRVLKLPDTPAVLLETAYISNAEEEQLLKKNIFRKTIASAVSSSVVNYFADSSAVASPHDANKPESEVPPGATKIAKATRPIKMITYPVKRGDNLNAIAKQHETTLATLLKLNRMKLNDPLYVGRKILIPVAVTEPADRKRLKKYTVKKGDTLFALAKSSSTTIDELRRLNHMTDDDVLWSGRKIKLPQQASTVP